MAETARETQFFVRRQATMPGNQAIEINMNVFTGETEKEYLARLARVEHMIDLVAARHQARAIEENISATQIQMDVLEDLHKQDSGKKDSHL